MGQQTEGETPGIPLGSSQLGPGAGNPAVPAGLPGGKPFVSRRPTGTPTANQLQVGGAPGSDINPAQAAGIM